MNERSITWALQAAKWAKEPYPASPSQTNFDALLIRIAREANKPGKMTVMRNQASIGMNNNYWPCLSRLAIMAHPPLAEYIHPIHRQPLDDDKGKKLLSKLFDDVVGHKPEVHDWEVAKAKYYHRRTPQ